MSMTCPCCTVDCKFNTLDSNVVDLNSTKGKPERSAASAARRGKFTTENRLLAKFEVCKPRDTSAQNKVCSSLGSRSLCKGLCHMRSMQQQASNRSNHCRNSSSQSKVSAKPKTHERKTLAFVLHEKDASEEIGSANRDVFKNNEPEFADRQVSSLHPSLPLCRQVTSDNMSQKHSKMHVESSSLPDYLFCSAQNDYDESEESEREIENSICLSSFTFGSKSQSLPLFESSKKALVRQLSSESCISMLSLDCTDDQLSARGCIEPFSSADLCTQEEMTKFSVCFPETRNMLGDEASIVEPCFEFGISGRPCIQPVPNQRMESEKMNFRNMDFPTRKGMSKGQTVLLNLEKDFQPHAKNKKRARSAINERHKVGNRRTKKAFLNFRRCRGIAGHNGALMDRVLNVGVGIGVSYMLFANWKEFKRLNDLLEKIQSFVQEMQHQAQCNNSTLFGCLSTLRMQASKSPQVKKNEQHVKVQNADSKAKCAVEPLLRNINMTDLETALEAELALMQQNLEGAERQASPTDVDENAEAQSSIVDDLLRICDHDKTRRHSSTNGRVLNVQHAVSPNALNRRLHEVLEAQQEKRILNLEAQIEAREIELMMKDKELQCWKDIAHHLVTSYRDKPEQTETRNIKDKRILFSDGYDIIAPQNSLSVTKDDRQNFLVDYLRCEDGKSIDSLAATSCTSEGVRNNQLSVRPDFLHNDNLTSTLIDPSFEALISRSTFDWPLEDFQTHSTVSAWKEGSDFSGLSEIARKRSNEAWADQDDCDSGKGLDADKMFPWLSFEEEHLAKFSHLGESSTMSNKSLQANEDYYCLSTAKSSHRDLI